LEPITPLQLVLVVLLAVQLLAECKAQILFLVLLRLLVEDMALGIQAHLWLAVLVVLEAVRWVLPLVARGHPVKEIMVV
jgi:hypothetical protein